VFVAAEEDDILGFAACGESRDVAGEGELYSIYALPEAWGTGAAPALMAAVRGALRASGFTTASLWVLEDNPRARRFYEREGWMSDGGRREEEFLEVPVAEIRYRIRLG
jgi:ribosomal protein S18 acetylase RimI-like enzyme